MSSYRILPIRGKSVSSRHSQSMRHILPSLRRKFFSSHSDKFIFNTRDDFDVSIVLDKGGSIYYNYGLPDFTFIIPNKEKPTMGYLEIDRYESDDSHALLFIIFPKERVVDIISPYALNIDELQAIYGMIPLEEKDRDRYPINDVPCLIDKPMKLRGMCAYNLQSDDTAEIGWCVAWMVKFSDILANMSKEEFWDKPWDIRRDVYKKLYDSFISIPSYNSMEVGRRIWAESVEKYNSLIGGKRKGRTLRKRKGGSKR